MSDLDEYDIDRVSQPEVSAAVEAANDKLAAGLEKAQITVGHDEIRPSTLMAFDAMQDAHEILCRVDPSRETPDDRLLDQEERGTQ